MKAKIINFEVLYTTKSVDILDLTKDLVLKEIDIASQEGCDSIIGLMLVDGFLYKDNEEYYSLLKFIQDYCYSKNIHDLVLIVGMCADYQAKLIERNLNYKIMFWDFNLNMVYQSYNNKETAMWNSSAEKFLFLGGVPSRPNRIVLLSKFYNKGLLRQSEYSFFPPWTESDKEWCKNALADMPNYDQFLIDCDRSIDNLYSTAKDYSRLSSTELLETKIHETDWCQNPGWIAPDVFYNTCFSIISEGNAYSPAKDYKFLTEKTWRTIVNRHPFIFAGEVEQYQYLVSKGLKTFEEYMIPYGQVSNEDNRFDIIVSNAKVFLQTIKESTAAIHNDIEHNFNIFVREAERNNSLLDFLSNNYSITQEELTKWFRQKSFTHLVSVKE